MSDDAIVPRDDLSELQTLCNELNALQVLCFEPVKGGPGHKRNVKPVAVIRGGRLFLSADANDHALLFFVSDLTTGVQTLVLTWEIIEWAEQHGGWFRVVWDEKTRPIGMEFVKAEECKNWS